jgi:hypothetical protein
MEARVAALQEENSELQAHVLTIMERKSEVAKNRAFMEQVRAAALLYYPFASTNTHLNHLTHHHC